MMHIHGGRDDAAVIQTYRTRPTVSNIMPGTLQERGGNSCAAVKSGALVPLIYCRRLFPAGFYVRKHIKTDVKVRLANADDVRITIYSVIRRPDYCSPAQKRKKKNNPESLSQFHNSIKTSDIIFPFFPLYGALEEPLGIQGEQIRQHHVARHCLGG